MALVSGDPGQAAGLHEQDDAMDTLHERLFDVIMDRRWPHSAAVGAKTALLGRYYERFADHAVEVGRRVVFMGTGALPAEDEISTY
jgi:phosphate transport system protein